MKLTRGKIRRRIGLDLKAKYDCHHGRYIWPEVGDRRSGRTTDMIVDVLERLQHSRQCIVVAYSAKYAHELVIQIKDYAYRLGVDASEVKPLSHIQLERNRNGFWPRDSSFIFFDHHHELTYLDNRLHR